MLKSIVEEHCRVMHYQTVNISNKINEILGKTKVEIP